MSIYLEKNNYENSDVFSGKSQENLANLISEYLKEDEIQLIGLEGRWGSGKSNLIRILKNQNENLKFFIYDAWAFQEEKNLKYSILLNFLNFLLSEELIKDKKIKDELDNLFSEFYKNNSTILDLGGNIEAKTGFLVKLGLSFNAKKTWNETKQIKKHKQILDFRQFLKEIDEILNEKTIIVIDNIDRLPKEKTKEIYGFINTFFAKDEYNENDKYKNIKIIIPYDKNYLNEVFDNFADEFIQKSFDISFMVPKQLPDDWKGFFDKKYKELFEDSNEEIKEIFENHTEEITPRKIICFLNELKYIHKFHTEILKEKIPIDLMALFILKKDEILKDPIAFIFDEDRNAIYENFIENMASIIYMVKKEKANAILEANIGELLEKIINALDYLKNFENINKSCRNIVFKFLYKKALGVYSKSLKIENYMSGFLSSIKGKGIDISSHEKYYHINQKEKIISQELMQDFYNELVKICKEKGANI